MNITFDTSVSFWNNTPATISSTCGQRVCVFSMPSSCLGSMLSVCWKMIYHQMFFYSAMHAYMQSPWGVLSWSACGYCTKIPKGWTAAWCENFQCAYFLHQSVSVTAWKQSGEMRHHPHLDCLLTLLESVVFMQMLSGDADILPLNLHIIYIHPLDSLKALSLSIKGLSGWSCFAM